MKALAFVLFLMAGVIQAAPASFAFDTSGWKSGDAQSIETADSVKVTIIRRGDARLVTVSRGDITNEYTLEPVDGTLSITSKKFNKDVIIDPGRITIDGVRLDGLLAIPPPRAHATIYICPKDETMLRVPHTNHSGEFKCPVDGTPMRPGYGPTRRYYLLDEDGD